MDLDVQAFVGCEPEVAAARAVRKIRRDDRSTLGWYRSLLPPREKGIAGPCRLPEKRETGAPVK